MATKYNYLQYNHDYTPLKELIANHNNPHLPNGIIDKILTQFIEINGENVESGDEIFIPILPPFWKKYENLLNEDEVKSQLVIKPSPEPKIIERVHIEPPPVIPETKPKELVIPKKKIPKKDKFGAPKEHIKKIGKLQYKLFPYVFSRPGETIEAVIRLYNDMSVGPATLKKLTYEFTRENLDALPPKLGQTVKVPVLLPFVYRHVNDNKIFKDK